MDCEGAWSKLEMEVVMMFFGGGVYLVSAEVAISKSAAFPRAF